MTKFDKPRRGGAHAALPLYAAVHAGTLKVDPHLLLPVI